MSRHQFPGIEPGTSVSIGWDRPLGTFFVQVLRPHPHLTGEDETVAWHGAHPGELTTAAAAVTIASRWADLPADLAITLETDRLMTASAGSAWTMVGVSPLYSTGAVKPASRQVASPSSTRVA